jgi:cbb3-type cytochrome oxidase maturation protein
MTILYILAPLAILLAGIGIAAFIWAVRSGQYDDVETPALRMILDDNQANHSPGIEDNNGPKRHQ